MSLRQSAISGVKWTSLSSGVMTILQLVQTIILMRLLTPTEFGLMGMLMVFVGFAQAFADMGISNAIIQRQDVQHEHLSSVYWLNLLIGGALFLLVWASTPLVVSFYSQPVLADMVFYMALTFLIIPVGQQFQTLLQKELQFSRLAKVEIVSVAVGSVVAISSAWLGQGVFSLIWGQLVSTLLRVLMLVGFGWKTWRPMIHFRRADIRPYISFGLYQLGERSVNYFSANIDYIVIGRFLGADMLGIYTLAYQLIVMPVTKINPILTRVLFPIFSRKQTQNAALRRGYLEMIRLLALIVTPILAGIGVTASMLIPLIYGETWALAVPLLQIMAMIGVCRALANPSGTLLLAKGRADLAFKWNTIVAATSTLVFLLVVKQGVFAVAWANLILHFFYFYFLHLILFRLVEIRWAMYIQAVGRAIGYAAFMGLALLGVQGILSSLFSNELVLYCSLVILGILIYGGLLAVFEKRYLIEIWSLVSKRKSNTGGGENVGE